MKFAESLRDVTGGSEMAVAVADPVVRAGVAAQMPTGSG